MTVQVCPTAEKDSMKIESFLFLQEGRFPLGGGNDKQGECSKNEYTHSYCRAAAVWSRSEMTEQKKCLHIHFIKFYIYKYEPF